MEDATKSADETLNLRALVHDLSNSLETILQAAYLLQQGKFDNKDKKLAQTKTPPHATQPASIETSGKY